MDGYGVKYTHVWKKKKKTTVTRKVGDENMGGDFARNLTIKSIKNQYAGVQNTDMAIIVFQ